MQINYDYCWFCEKPIEENQLSGFTFEFDCWFHLDCLKEKLLVGDTEAKIIAKEHNITLGDL